MKQKNSKEVKDSQRLKDRSDNRTDKAFVINEIYKRTKENSREDDKGRDKLFLLMENTKGWSRERQREEESEFRESSEKRGNNSQDTGRLIDIDKDGNENGFSFEQNKYEYISVLRKFNKKCMQKREDESKEA